MKTSNKITESFAYRIEEHSGSVGELYRDFICRMLEQHHQALTDSPFNTASEYRPEPEIAGPTAQRAEANAKEMFYLLCDAVEDSGFGIGGPTDSRAAEHGEPKWVCRAREIISQIKGGPIMERVWQCRKCGCASWAKSREEAVIRLTRFTESTPQSPRCEHPIEKVLPPKPRLNQITPQPSHPMNTTTQCKHTPGPWEIFPNYENDTITIGVYGKHAPLVSAVCELPCLASEPDARIIAAAPELLEALKRAANHLIMSGTKCTDAPEALAQARAAIAKAEGAQ